MPIHIQYPLYSFLREGEGWECVKEYTPSLGDGQFHLEKMWTQ